MNQDKMNIGVLLVSRIAPCNTCPLIHSWVKFQLINLIWICLQLRSTYNKLEFDLSSSKKRYMELVEQRDNLRRGREDSVRFFCVFLRYLHCNKHIVPTHAFPQEEREAALEELKAVELHHKKLKVPLYSLFLFWGSLIPLYISTTPK